MPQQPENPIHKFKIGLAEGEIENIPDFSEPLPEEEIARWQGRGDDHQPSKPLES